MTMYAQRSYLSIMSDPKAKERLQYVEWKKTVKPADPKLVMSLIQKGL